MKLKLSLLLFIIYMYASMWAQQSHTFTTNGSLLVPSGVTTMNAQAWGAGGAGGGARDAGTGNGRAGGGGGGGAYAAAAITVIPGATINPIVGGQTAGTIGDGATGASSTISGFQSTILAMGGSGGLANTAGSNPVAGGAGGSNTTSVGTTKTSGSTGGDGGTSVLSILFSSGIGGNAASPGGGTGGASVFSIILGVNSSGNTGNPPGGGGSGAMNANSGIPQIGGTGARGQVIIGYTCPTYSLSSTSAMGACAASGTSLVSLTSSAANLPVGTYVVTYNRSNPSQIGLTANMTVSTPGLGSFTATGLTAIGTSNITITNLISGDCSSNITTNNVATGVTVSATTVGGTVNTSKTICSGLTSGTLTLSGHTGTILKWQSSIDSFATFTDIVNATTTYTSGALTVTTQFRAVIQNGACPVVNSIPVTITVNSLPTITLGAVTPVCINTNAQNTTLAYTATTNTPTTYSIVWNALPANSFAIVTDVALPATPITIAVPAGTGAGTYIGTITVKNANTCTSSPGVNFNVVVNPLPTITLGTVGPVCTNAGAQNTTLAYTATTNTPTTYSIVWNASPANSFTAVTNTTLTGSPITIPVPAGTAPGTYIGTITVKNANTCTSSPGVNFNVVVNSLPTITLGAVTAICTNVSAQSTSLAYTATTNTPTTYSIVWNALPTNSFAAVTDIALPATPITIDVPAGTGAGTYIGTITVKNANSCTSSAGVNFNVVVNPLPTITLGTVIPVCTSASAQNTTLVYTGTTNIPTTYSIVWNVSPTNSFAAVTNAALTGSPITIAVPAGTIAGTYTGTVTVRNANTCTSSLGVNFNVVVNPLPSITLGTVTPVCTSAATQNTTLAYTGTTNIPTTYSIVWNTSPANSFATVINAALTGSPITIAVPAGTSAGTYTGTITVQNANTCTSSPGVNFNVLVNPLPSAPVIGTITHPTCLIPTGSISLSGLPAGGTLTRYPGVIAEPYSGTAVIISGLSANTYTFTANNGTCTSLLSSNAVVPGLVTNTYTTSWSNGTPTLDQNILFAGDFVTAGGGAGNVNGCSCTVNSGVTVTVQFLDTLTLVNALTNNGGTVNFQNNSSFLQNTNAVNTGNISYKRTSPQITLTDFVYWSTPVSPQRLIDVSPLSPSDKFYGYNGTTWVPNNPTSNMIVGKGYIIRAPNNYSNTVKTDYTASFVGVPNNGDLFGETLTGGKFYLVGNPYPSALEANAFITANTFLDGTLYFWTHNTPVVLTGAYRYNADDYASYNLTGGVGIGQSALSGTPQNNNRTPNGKIAAGQSFFVSTNSAGTIAFTNAMRSGGVNNSHFFKSANTSNAIAERHRVWLNMTNDGGAFKQILVGYVEGASNNDESGYDGKTFDGNRYLDFYSVANGNNYVIQGRALPFIETDTVELGYRSTITGDFTISIDHADGDLINHPIYLEDKITNVIHDLQASSYTFSTSTGTFTDRFVLRYTNKTLGIGDFEQDNENVVIIVQNKLITITSDAEKIGTVYLYDLSGKIIYKETNLSDNIVRIDNLKVQNQVLLVKVILDTNESKIYKIIY